MPRIDALRFCQRHLSFTLKLLSLVCTIEPMKNAAIIAQRRLLLLNHSVRPTRSYRTLRDMPSPQIRKIGPLSADEAKWTELRKIEVMRVSKCDIQTTAYLSFKQWVDQVCSSDIDNSTVCSHWARLARTGSGRQQRARPANQAASTQWL